MEFTDLLKLIYENDIVSLENLKLDGVDFCKTDNYDKNNLLIAYAGYSYDNKYEPKDLIDFLLKCGIEINHKRNKRGNELSALHKAVAMKNYKIVEHLLKRKAQIDIQEVNGNTPLWTAVMNYRGEEEQLKIINLLLKNDASLDIKNLHNKSARDMINIIGGGIDAAHNKKEWDLRYLLTK
ncbi:MAG: ankyrin repeat domain-containing protein [Flavobacterium sp.]|nr:MAG: ankyrin repeat domain-containing protein [Flavobacterium sp.]